MEENSFQWKKFPVIDSKSEKGTLIVTGKGSIQHLLKIKRPRNLIVQLVEDPEMVTCSPETDDDVSGSFKLIDAGKGDHAKWAIEIEWSVQRQRAVTWCVEGDKI